MKLNVYFDKNSIVSVIKGVFRFFMLTLLLLVVFLFILPLYVYFYYRQFIYVDVKSVESTNIAIVFGSAAYNAETASPSLGDRLQTAAQLYKEGKIKKILVSGDNGTENYNEPLTMYNVLVKLGVNGDDITKDFAGFRTYDTCVRAKRIFGVDKALLISQGFHLPRALFLCKSVGIDAVGIYSSGDFSTYYNRWYSLREVLAIYNAFIDLYITPPSVTLGTPEPIKE